MTPCLGFIGGMPLKGGLGLSKAQPFVASSLIKCTCAWAKPSTIYAQDSNLESPAPEADALSIRPTGRLTVQEFAKVHRSRCGERTLTCRDHITGRGEYCDQQAPVLRLFV